MKFGLSEEVVQKITNVFLSFPEIEKSILYGSRAKGNFKPGSDIDLTLIGSKLNSDIRNSIAIALDDLLLPYMIDLSIYSELEHSELKNHIDRVGVLFYAKKKFQPN